MAEQLKTVVDRLLSGLLGDAEHADKARPQLMVDMLSDWLPYRVYDPATRLTSTHARRALSFRLRR